jgi:hypothetical protein
VGKCADSEQLTVETCPAILIETKVLCVQTETTSLHNQHVFYYTGALFDIKKHKTDTSKPIGYV